VSPGIFTDERQADHPSSNVRGRHLGRVCHTRKQALAGVSHSGVPSELGGRLVLAAAGRAPSEGLTMVPSCPLAGDWLERDPDTTGMAAPGAE
jgi:predicted GNAT family acetyltransferase